MFLLCQVQNSKTHLEKQQDLMHTSPFIQYNSNMLLLVNLEVSLGQKMSCELLPAYSQKVCKIRDKKHCLSREQPDSCLGYVMIHDRYPKRKLIFQCGTISQWPKTRLLMGFLIFSYFFHMMEQEKKERIKRTSGVLQTHEKYIHIHHIYMSAV